jgi:hypothetical protein
MEAPRKDREIPFIFSNLKRNLGTVIRRFFAGVESGIVDPGEAVRRLGGGVDLP